MKFKNCIVTGDKCYKRWFVEELKARGIYPKQQSTDTSIKNSDYLNIVIQCVNNQYFSTDVKAVPGDFKIFHLPQDWKAAIEYVKEKELEVGKWYKLPLISDKFMFYFNGDFGNGVTYGFDKYSNWTESLSIHTDQVDSCVEVTNEEVEKELIKEAKKRYKEGDKIKEMYFGNDFTIDKFVFDYSYTHNLLRVKSTKGSFYGTLFYKGKWPDKLEEYSNESKYPSKNRNKVLTSDQQRVIVEKIKNEIFHGRDENEDTIRKMCFLDHFLDYLLNEK